jgi:2-dehydro-3-deoxygluconokinase
MDLVTFGEGLIRLTFASETLAQGPGVSAYVGGSELNVAVGAAHLGVASRWISRLPDNAIGRLVDGAARVHGVDTSVDWTADGRVGLYFLRRGSAPRQSSVLYDRAGSAFSRIPPRSTDWAPLFDGARWFHLSGVTPALSNTTAEVSAEALKAAKAAGLTVSYDVNYRVKLWDAARARAVQEPLLPHVDVLIVSQEDARMVFDVGDHSAEQVARTLSRRYGVPAVVVTLRDSVEALGAVVIADGEVAAAPRYDVEIVERVGTGDAFCAGLISSRLRNGGWEDAVRFGSAAAALKLTMPGDFFIGGRPDVEKVLETISTLRSPE